MEIQHFSHKEHPLTFVEELENDGEIKEIVCSGCDQSISAPAYKCSHCNFFLHKSCAELPGEIQHPVHPNHTLVLVAPFEEKFCDACGKCCKRCFAYRCDSCDFDIDIECASASLPTKPDDGHQHEFVPIFQQIHFTCELCGEDRNNAAQVCRICQLLADSLCALKPRTIKIIAADRHMLTLVYSLGKVILKEHDPVFCNLCYKKVNFNYAAYYCQQCNFVAHLDCAVEISIELPGDTIDSSIEEEKGILFKEAEEGEELQHFDHERKLIISRNEVEVHDHKLCKGCMQSIISAPFYSCDQCNYFLHSTCARLPLMKRHPTHPHKLTLSARGKYIDSLKFCYACDRLSHGFAYICDECDNYSLDIRCSSIPIKTFKHEGHQHSLFLATSSVEKCNACDRSENYGRIFVCTECNFALCFTCATLPLKTKYDYDQHPLSLTSIAENDSQECYCLICEEERNPNHWFYYCVECNFVAHPHCVVGKFPYVKYGRNFIRKDHQHPLSLVWRTKDSRPCDACSQTFDGGVAINCTQCKSIIHWSNKCFDKLFKNKITS